MLSKRISIYGGELIVVVENEYCVYEKEVPLEARKFTKIKIDWVGNFGLTDTNTYKPLNGYVDPYKILVRERDGILYYWDGANAVQVPLQRTEPLNGVEYRSGVLDLGDPAIGWG